MDGFHTGELGKLNPNTLFDATCLSCKSKNVSAEYTCDIFSFGTGWDIRFTINCRDCKKVAIVRSETG